MPDKPENNEIEMRNILIKIVTADKLKSIGTMADSYDTVITRLIFFWERYKGVVENAGTQ